MITNPSIDRIDPGFTKTNRVESGFQGFLDILAEGNERVRWRKTVYAAGLIPNPFMDPETYPPFVRFAVAHLFTSYGEDFDEMCA